MTNDSRKIPSNRIRIADHSVHVGAGTQAAREPHIEVVRNASGVRGIRLTCRCGEVLCLDLEYTGNAA